MGRRNIPTRSFMNTLMQSEVFCPVADANWIKDDWDASAVAAGDEVTSLDQSVLPSLGRNVTALLTNAGASTVEITILVEGYDQHGQVVSEQISGLSKSGGAQTGSKIFKRITKVSVVSIDAGSGAAGDVLDVGFGDRLGMLARPSELTDKHAVNKISISRNQGGTYAELAGTSTYVDLTYGCLKAIGTGGSGAIASGDQFIVHYRLDYDDTDDRDFL